MMNTLRDVKIGEVIVVGILGWQTAKQEQVARRRLRDIGIAVDDHVDALRAYIALQREFPLGDLPALETFIVPE